MLGWKKDPDLYQFRISHTKNRKKLSNFLFVFRKIKKYRQREIEEVVINQFVFYL